MMPSFNQRNAKGEKEFFVIVDSFEQDRLA
jgi:hypothetical protein